jgi:tetratricopeptide (TPR) repeat protein
MNLNIRSTWDRPEIQSSNSDIRKNPKARIRGKRVDCARPFGLRISEFGIPVHLALNASCSSVHRSALSSMIYRPDIHLPLKRVARLCVACLVLAAWLSSGCGGSMRPEPPAISLTSLDSGLADLLQRSRDAVVATPKSADAWGKLGQAFHVAEFSREAQECYRRAIALDASSPRWIHLLSLLQLQEQPDEAIRGLARAAELAGTQPDAPRVRLIQALVERGRYDEAVESIRSLLARNPSHLAARLESARVSLARNEVDRAAAALEPCLTNAYTMRPAMLLLAQVRQRQGDSVAAAELSRRAARMPRPFDWPDPFLREVQNLRIDQQSLTDQVNGLLMQQRLKEAEAALAPLLKSRPNDPEVLLMLGRLRFLERNCPEAEGVFRRLLTIQPESLNGLMQLSLAILCQQRWSDAVAPLRRIISLKPDFTQAHYNLGYALARLGDAPGAIRSYREALRSSPGDMAAHLALAEELFLSGQRDAAFSQLSRAAELNPEDPRIPKLRERLQRQPEAARERN